MADGAIPTGGGDSDGRHSSAGRPRIGAGIFASLLVGLPVAFLIFALLDPGPKRPFMVTLLVLALAFFVGLPAHFFVGYRFPWILPGLVALFGVGLVVTGVMTGFDARLLFPGTVFLIVGLTWNQTDRLPQPFASWISNVKERWTK